MRRKYLYFKVFDLKDHPQEVLAFSQIEIEQIVGPVTAIDNIFQLTQQPEIKRIIEKDINLQNALTDSLPGRGRHGYLWSGEVLPDIFEAISKLAYIKEIFLFQQMLEPEPGFLKEKMGSMPYHEMNIYLWRVYRFWTFEFLLSRAQYIAGISRHENDIDEKFRQMVDELSQAPGILFDRDPAEMIAYNPDQSIVNYSLDPRAGNEQDLRWLQALSNHLTNDTGPALLAPFCTESALAQQALLAGHHILAFEKNHLYNLFTRANAALLSVSAQTFNTLSVEIHTKIKLIVNTKDQTQTDLFMYSSEGQFLSFWKDERSRLDRIGPIAFDIVFLKHVAATRFLIESETLTKDAAINTLFSAALAIALYRALSRKRQPAFYELFSGALRDIYTHLYLLRKITSLLAPAFGKLEIHNLSPLLHKPENPIDGSIVLLPDHPVPMISDKEQALASILNYGTPHHPDTTGAEGGEDLAKTHFIEDEIRQKKGFYKKLPKSATDLLTRLELYGQRNRVTEFYRLLKLYHSILELLRDKLPVGARIAMILPPMEVKIETDNQPVPLDAIMLGFLESDKNLSLRFIRQISRRVHKSKAGSNKTFTVLLLQKA